MLLQSGVSDVTKSPVHSANLWNKVLENANRLSRTNSINHLEIIEPSRSKRPSHLLQKLSRDCVAFNVKAEPVEKVRSAKSGVKPLQCD